MLRLVNLLSAAVRRFPWITILVVLVLFGVLGSFISQQEIAEGNEGFAPEAPELDAANEIQELFGADSSGTVMQVVITSESGDVITADGLDTVAIVEQVLADSELSSDLLDTGQGAVVSYMAPVQPIDAGQGPSLRVVVSSEDGDVFTTQGQRVVDQIVGALAATPAATKLDSAAPAGPVSSFVTPLMSGSAQGPTAQVAVSSQSGDVITSEGLAASLTLQQAVFQSQFASKLNQGDPAQPPVFTFMAPVEFAVNSGQFDPGSPTPAVKAAWTQALGALPEPAAEAVPFLLSNDQDLDVPSASHGIISFSLTEPFTPEEATGFAALVDGVSMPEGVELQYLPAQPIDDATLKATYNTRSQFLPAEAAGFLPFLSSTDADLSVPRAAKGLVVVSLTEDLTAEESAIVADALASIDTPDGYRVGYLPVDPSTDQIKQAYADNLAFVPPEFAGQAAALLSDDADADAITASSGLMIVFLEQPPADDAAGFEDFSARQQDFVDDLAGADLADGMDAGAFSFGLIFAAGGDATSEIGRMFGLAAAIIIVVLLFNFWIRIRGARGNRRAVRRTVADTVLTLITIMIAISWMQGLGVLLGPKYLGLIGDFNQVVQILPILIIGLGVDYGIHMTSRYREELSAGETVPQSVHHAIRTVGVALVLATLTTMVGFLTNLVSPVPALADFGVLAAVGILSAFVLMLTFVPAVRLLLDRRAEREGKLDLWALVLLPPLGWIPRVRQFRLSKGEEKGPFDGTDFDLDHVPGLIGPLVFGAVSGFLAYMASVGLEMAIEGEAFSNVFEQTSALIFAGVGAAVGVILLQLPRITGGVSVVAEKFAWGVVIIALVLAGVGELGRQQLDTSFTFTDFVPTDNPLLETFDIIVEDFGGGFGETTNVLVGGEGQDVATVAVHNAQVDAWNNLKDTPNVLQFGGEPAVDVSPVQVLADLQDPLSPIFSPEFVDAAGDLISDDYRLPDGTDVVSFYGLMAEYAPDAVGAALHADGAGGYDAALWTINTSAGDTEASQLREDLVSDFAPVSEEVEAVPTSDNIINNVVVDSLSESQLSSLLITLAAATLLLVLNFWIEARRPALGIITMLPVGLVVLLTFGMMALRGIPFGPVTATISALAVGIGVPFTIHITHRFLEDRVRLDSTEEAVASTTRHTGAALAGSAFTTMAGFGSLVTSNLTPFRQFGEVTFWAILFALLGSLVLLPSMLVIWDRYHRRRGDELLDRGAVEAALDVQA